MKKKEIEFKKAELIIDLVNDYFNTECRNRDRYKITIISRQIAMYLIRKNTKLSFMLIGSLFKRGHDTVLYSVNRIKDTMPFDREIRFYVDDLKNDAKLIGKYEDIDLKKHHYKLAINEKLDNLDLSQLKLVSKYLSHKYINQLVA